MQQAIPATEYNADERAERAKGAAIVFLALVVVAAVGIAATLLIIFAH